jgi:hypothetical protein
MLALDGGELSASCPGHFTPVERVRGIHCMGVWVGPIADIDTVEKRSISCLLWKSHPTPSLSSLYCSLTSDLK